MDLPESSVMQGSGDNREGVRPVLRAMWPRLIELWIALVLLTFFVVRVLGSGSWQRILARLGHHLHG